MNLNFLVDQIGKCISLNEQAIEAIKRHFVSLNIKNKEYLLEDNHTCKYYYFVNKGCLRMFFYDEKVREHITDFAIEGWWMTDYKGFYQQLKSDYYIQAIEPTEVLAINYQSYNQLLDEAPSLERYFRIISQRALGASQVRTKLNVSLSKEDMYLHFSSSFPGFVQRVPQYMLASFLGITPEYLSEIRKKSK